MITHIKICYLAIITKGWPYLSNLILLSSFFHQVESGGTVLSTNWKEVGDKKVEMKAPDGMEYKKYEM